MTSATNSRIILTLVLFLFSLSIVPAYISAQTEDPAVLKKQAKALMDAAKLTEALPLYEKLARLTPNDREVHLYLGFALMGQVAVTTDPAVRKQLRVRARNAFVRTKELGDDSVAVIGYIDGIPVDGSEGSGFSDNAEANKLMNKGEAAFASGKLDDALAAYQSALKIDPLCYHAALFSGDVYKSQNKFDDAETWYQKAIAIDPYTETAYRYSATPLMQQGKIELARDRYVEAFITEPYNRLALSGIIQWGEITKTRLGHPVINVPEITFGSDGKATSTINVNPGADDGSIAWASYVSTREAWRKEKFAKMFPGEKQYRHTLKEEADALRSVVVMAKSLKPKKLDPQIAKLSALDQDGLLEAFILLAIPDKGIAQDHANYLRANRDKLRQYVLNYVIEKKTGTASETGLSKLSVKGFGLDMANDLAVISDASRSFRGVDHLATFRMS